MRETQDNNRPARRHPDLDAVLRDLSPEEAARLREVWTLAAGEGPDPSPSDDDVEGALAHLVAGITRAANRPPAARPGAPRARTARPARRPTRRRAGARGFALAVAVVIGTSLVLWWALPVVHQALPGQRLVLELPDGSRVELNSGARVKYARRFGEVRRTRLTGEAFFDVVDDGRAFVVETFNAEVRVLGTRFGVRAWPASLERATTVTLEGGRVTLAPAGRPDRAVVMAPGETRRVVSGDPGMLPRVAPGLSVRDATAWRRGDLIFKDQLLAVVLQDVERRFGVDVRLEATGLAEERISLALRQPARAEAVVRDLAQALGLSYRETSKGYALFQKPKPGPDRQ